jgi:hypothetical protein
MKMALSEGILTLRSHATGKLSRVDNVFCSEVMLDLFVLCDTRLGERPPRSDHFPLVACLDLSLPTQVPVPRLNWRAVDWETFHELLSAGLSSLPAPVEITSIPEFDKCLEDFNRIVDATIA